MTKKKMPTRYNPTQYGPIAHKVIDAPDKSSKKKKTFLRKKLIFKICAILGGLLIIGLTYKRYSLLYGPPPINEGQRIFDNKQIQPLLYGPPPIQGQHNIDSIIKPQKLEPE